MHTCIDIYILSIKRLIGRRISELESKMYELLPYYIMSNETSGFASVQCPNTDSVLMPEQVRTRLECLPFGGTEKC